MCVFLYRLNEIGTMAMRPTLGVVCYVTGVELESCIPTILFSMISHALVQIDLHVIVPVLIYTMKGNRPNNSACHEHRFQTTEHQSFIFIAHPLEALRYKLPKMYFKVT